VANQFQQGSAKTRESESFEFAALSEARNYRAAIAKLFSPYLNGDVLEVGAGIGQMLEEVAAVCNLRSISAVEPDPHFVEELRRNLPQAQVWHGLEDDLPLDMFFDAILSVNVLEHIERDTVELTKWRKRLAPREGHLCLLVPARPEIYSLMDSDFGHFRRYTRRDLSEKLSAAGFTEIKVNYFNMVGYFAWLLNFKILNSRHFNASAVRLFDRFVFPTSQRIENAIRWRPFGQSLVAVAKS
jgi:SAM-dependent methyltransferase